MYQIQRAAVCRSARPREGATDGLEPVTEDPVRLRADPSPLARTRGALRRAGACGLALALGPTALAGQASVVTGSVYDSINGEPLVDAAVFLWETPYRAATDELGRFRIEGVPPGDYSILFFHTRLGEMGISPGPRPILVSEGGAETEIELAMPSMRTVIASQCLFEERGPSTGILTGWVRDGASELRLGGTTVVLTWEPRGSKRAEQLELQTGAGGWYHTCNAPAGVPLLGSVTFFGREAPRREIIVPENGFAEASFSVEPNPGSIVAGRVVDASTGDPVEAAEVWLRGTSEHRLTDGRGGFSLERVPAGRYMLMAEHVEYGTKMDTLEVPSGQRLTIEMRLDTRPIPIAPITVEVEGFEPLSARMAGGVVVSRQQIDEVRQRSRDAGDIMRSLHLPGIFVRQMSDGTVCIGTTAGQVRMFSNGCAPMVIFINDVRATSPELALRLPPESIERMVVYKPVEAGNLFGLGGGNGVWLIYTRGN